MDKNDVKSGVLKKVYLTYDQIDKRLNEIAKQIDNDFKDKKDILMIGVLNGAFVVLSDLIKKIHNPGLEVDFLSVSSYGDSKKSSGHIQLNKDLGAVVTGRDVIIVEDIVDTGITMKWLIDHLIKSRGAKSVKIFTLIRRKMPENANLILDYVGFVFDTPDYFVGYGFDNAQKYRHLNCVATI